MKMRECPVWSSETTLEFEESKKNCENFIFRQLHEPLFQFATASLEDSLSNQRTHDRIESLQFLSAEHLDIRSLQYLLEENSSAVGYSEANLLSDAIQHLAGMEKATSPDDKLLCLRNCSVAIAQILKAAHDRRAAQNATKSSIIASNPNGIPASNSDPHKKVAPGADELLPVMILTIKWCNPKNIHSEIKFLQHFLRPSRMVSEAGKLLNLLLLKI